MFKYLRKKKVLAIIEDEMKFYWDLYNTYTTRIDQALNLDDRKLYGDMALEYFARYTQSKRIYDLLNKL